MYAIRNEHLESDSDSNYEDEDELTRIIPPEVEDTTDWVKARHILGLLGFLGFANVYAMRVNLSVAIVAMVYRNTTQPNNNNTYDHCVAPNSSNSTQPPNEGEFNWDEATQGLVLGSFFYGYVLTQVPGGRLAELFGGKLIYGIGVLMTAVFTLLSPIAARYNFTLFIIVRVLEGMGEGVTFPSMHAMLARWIPPLEQSKFAAYVYAGNKDKKKAIGCRLFKVVKDNSDEIMNHIKKNVCSGRSLFSENVNILHFN
jgi:MFS family permease